MATKLSVAITKIFRLIGRFLRFAFAKIRIALTFIYKKLHFHVAHKPHTHLMNRYSWYKNWHEWRYHSHVHVSILVPYVFVVLAIVIFSFKSTMAASQIVTWDFSNASNFSFDVNSVEINGTSASLKAQNYSSDANTALLIHSDEENGSTANDSSSQSNDASLVGDSVFGAGRLNNGIALDGNGDYLSVPDSPSLTLGGQHTIEAWTKFNTIFSTSTSHDQGIVDKGGYKLYYDRTSGKINYEIASNSANSWTRQAGSDTNNSWDKDGKSIIRSSVIDGTIRYAGLGLGTGDAEVWRYDGSTWTLIGGDGKNGSWANQMFEDVNALVKSGDYLYAGLGTNAAGDAEVWRCNVTSNCTDWDKIGGDGLNSGWQISMFESVLALEAYGGNVYAGLGASANDAEVWRWNGSTWTKIGGDSANGGWTTNYEAVRSLTNDGTNLYAGVGDTAAEAEVYRWNGSTWTKIGGDGLSGSWAVADNIEYVSSLNYFGGNLYAGTGLTAGDGDLWMYNGTSWTKIGGDGLNSSWAASTYELVASLANDGTNLYAGVGNGNGEGEVYRWDGAAWAKIGGDGLNGSWTTNMGDGIYALAYGDNRLMAGAYDSAGNGTTWEWNGSTWVRTGGGYVNQSWGYYNLQSVESSATLNEKLYVGTGVAVAGNAMVWESDGQNWNMIGGQGVNNSWLEETFENVFALQTYKGELYAGLGTTANDAEVWKYNGTSWTQVGGDSLNSGWLANYESVYSLTVYNGSLYAGLGASANDAEVWRWDGTSWAKVGGDSMNSGWTTNYEAVYSLTVFDGNLYAGLGASVNDAEIWRYNGTAWTKIGGDGLAGSWNTVYEEVYIMRVFNNNLVVGLGNGTEDAEVWQYDGAVWSQVGGDDLNGSWTSGTYERVRAMAIYNGELYTGIGDTAGDGEVWKYDGTSWTQVGGDSINSGWTNVVEYVSTLIDFKGKLYAGTGNSGNADALVWSIGNNAFLSSEQSTQDTNWHHVAATYNGSVMKIYIDGVENASADASVTIPDNDLPLNIGSTFGSGGRGEAQGSFNGTIDEVRISSIARTSFITKPYPTTKQTISLANAVMTSGIRAYVSFSADETLNGGSIAYRLSDDDGASWKYWNGSNWVVSNNPNEANTETDVNINIATFPVTFDGIKWQAVVNSDGNQQVVLNSATVEGDTDTNAPNVNASNVVAKKVNGGSNITSGSWTNGASPYFSWDAGEDAESDILGYCLYLGHDNTANPETTGGLFGPSLIDNGEKCQFATSDTSIDLATAGVLASPLVTSNDLYYILVKAIDKAGNTYPTTAAFEFKFDNTPPTNPSFISAPSGFVSTKDVTFTWPTSGDQAPYDNESGLIGMQYRIEDTGWYGDTHNGLGDSSDLLVNDGVYSTQAVPDYDNIVDGINTVYFRSWDLAGNISSSSVNAVIKMNTSGAPSEPLSVDANPNSNTVNLFSFSWEAPTTFVGDEDNLNYCYTINTLPSASTCNYTGPGIKSLSEGPYATQPGQNTLYVVARDESNSINYSSYDSVKFHANTAAPGIAGNIDIVDVSIKSTSNWRLAITWDEPVDSGVGISSYRIYRSVNGADYDVAGTSTSTTYIDAGLDQQVYYYYVIACDSTNNCSADSPDVSMLPTGKFTEPAELISDPGASEITTRRAHIHWMTDRESDSKVAIGTESGVYGASEIGSSDQVVMHNIELDNLVAGTTYYYQVKWTDEDGNTGESQEFTFTTKPAPVIKEVETIKVTLSSAVIRYTSVGANKVNLYFGESEAFGGLQSINTSNDESIYNMEMAGLKDGTKYYYKLSSFDSEGSEYFGNIFSFTTPPRPRITSLRFQPVAGEPTSTQSITWSTNVPSTSTVTFGKVGTNGTDIQLSKLVTDHTIVISGLEDDSQYFLIAQSRDADGNLAVSDRQEFRTSLDTRPPNVAEVNMESSIRGTGAEARGQVIVSWKTDEPSTSQVAYAEGSAATVFNNRTSEDTQMTTEHIVVLSNLPTSKVYSIQVMSYDKARNVGLGEPEASIIGRANESVLTVILNALQRIFGL